MPTQQQIRKDTIKMKCKACGGDSIIDMSQERHARLNNYIIKHPPEPKISKAEKKCVGICCCYGGRKTFARSHHHQHHPSPSSDWPRLSVSASRVWKMGKRRKRRRNLSTCGCTGVIAFYKACAFPCHRHVSPISKPPRDKKDKKASAEETNGNDEKPTVDEDTPAADEEDDVTADAPEDDDNDDDDVEWLADTSEEAMRKRAAEQLTAATAAMVHAPTDAPTNGSTNAADAALAADAQRKLTMQQQTQQEEEEESSEEEDEDLVEELRSAASTLSPEKVASALARIEIEGGPIGRMKLLYEALFAGPGKASLAERVETHKELLTLHAGSATEQLAQLLAMEYLLVTVLPDRSKEVIGWWEWCFWGGFWSDGGDGVIEGWFLEAKVLSFFHLTLSHPTHRWRACSRHCMSRRLLWGM